MGHSGDSHVHMWVTVVTFAHIFISQWWWVPTYTGCSGGSHVQG
jgi:hypothetical protein